MRTWIQLLLCLLLVPAVNAQQDPAPVKKAVEAWLAIQTKGLPGQVSYEIRALDPANQLTPCKSFDISRPPNSPPWGRGNVTVRCLDEAGWRIQLPVHIRVSSEYLISARPIPQGQVIVAEDLSSQFGDLSQLPANALVDPGMAIGKVAVSTIPIGRPLRADMLRAEMVIRQGQTVKVVSRGPGFAVANEGRALNNAQEGQLAQVRLGNGQVISGIAKAGGTVEIGH